MWHTIYLTIVLIVLLKALQNTNGVFTPSVECLDTQEKTNKSFPFTSKSVFIVADTMQKLPRRQTCNYHNMEGRYYTLSYRLAIKCVWLWPTVGRSNSAHIQFD